jgi:hypothetical protein
MLEARPETWHVGLTRSRTTLHPRAQDPERDLDRLVQQPRKAVVDAAAVDDWAGLADPLPDHPGHLRLRLPPGAPPQSPLERRDAVRYQLGGEPDLHTDPVRHAQPAAGSGRYRHRVGDHYLDDRGDLEIPQMGRGRSAAVFHLGVDRHRSAADDHLLELGQVTL